MTEKNYNPNQKENKAMKKGADVKNLPLPVEAEKKIIDEKVENKIETKPEVKKEEKKKVEKIRKTEAVVNGVSLPISTKKSGDMCRFIKNKKVEDAIKMMDEIIQGKRAIHAKGEYAHRPGVGSGKIPVRVAEEFKILLKSVLGNAKNHEIENPYVCEAKANMASRPFGSFGAYRRKRSHIFIKVKGAKK